MTKSTVRGNTVVKTTIALPEETLALLQELAERRNASYAEVVTRALNMEKYISEAREEGSRVLVDDPGKLIKEIIVF